MATGTTTTNQQLADRIGCHYTMASRLLNGQRLPSFALMHRISQEYKISLDTLIRARLAGPVEFSALLRKRIG